MCRVKGQYFVSRQRDRNRGITEGLLPMVYVNRVFDTRTEAEEFVKRTFPQPEKMREYSEIIEI